MSASLYYPTPIRFYIFDCKLLWSGNYHFVANNITAKGTSDRLTRL